MGVIPILTGMTIHVENGSRLRAVIGQPRQLIFAIAAFAMTWLFGASAQAVVVGTVMDTTVNPANYEPTTGPDWTQGDPGWESVTTGNSINYVYLGDNWVLSARHTGFFSAVFSTGTFAPLYDVVVHNPPAALAGGVTLTAQTDLRLTRINGNPGVDPVTIATESPPVSGVNGSEVVFIGQGRTRFANETHWAMNLSSPPPQSEWPEAEVPAGQGNVHGYKTSTTRTKRWGTNRLENPSNGVFESDAFDEILSPTTAVMPLTTQDTVTRDVISMVTIFNQQNEAGALPFESQAVSGDSGGSVFYNRGTAGSPDWVLAGIVNATLNYENQPPSYAIYGNATTFADLWYYNQPYKSSICDIMKACGSYSIVGDVNIDGNVTGDGTGNALVDDVTAFVNGWGFDNLAGKGDYDTWTKGDLDLDGVTDVDDFLLLRSALNGPIANSALQRILGVPEPSSVFLVMAAAAFIGACRRRRRVIRTSL
jgi:hypothetical protein